MEELVFKKCHKCETTKAITEYSKHSGTKDKLDNRCKACVKEVKKVSKEAGVVKEYKVYDLDLHNTDWQVGKVSGSIISRDNRYEGRIKIDKQTVSKAFYFKHFPTKEEAWNQAEVYLKDMSYKSGLTRNKIRVIDTSTIEVAINDKIMITDLKFHEVCQKYTLNLTKGGGKNPEYYACISIGNNLERFHNYITGFSMVDHINRNPLDNRLENLRDCTHKINNNNRDPVKKNTITNITGVKYDSRDNSYIGRIKQDGRQYSKSFAVKKYGDEEAKRLAVEYRQKLCEDFSCKNS